MVGDVQEGDGDAAARAMAAAAVLQRLTSSFHPAAESNRKLLARHLCAQPDYGQDAFTILCQVPAPFCII